MIEWTRFVEKSGIQWQSSGEKNCRIEENGRAKQNGRVEWNESGNHQVSL